MGSGFLKPTVKLGRVLGVEVGLHYSWLIIAALITLSLAGHFQSTHPEWGSSTIWLLALATGVLFFTSIVVHELSHAAVARLRHLPVRSITLFALGGVAQIEREAEDAKTEFWVGIVGPITSAAIGLACLGGAMLAGWGPGSPAATPLLAMLVWLGYINVTLAIFNMVPGFPLDGGRVLRAILWWKMKDADRATRLAARVGQSIAFGFIVLGLFRFFAGAGLGGLWIAFIGWFLLQAARDSYARVQVASELRGVTVGEIMARDCPAVDSRENLKAFADDYVLRTGRRCFIVLENERVAGLITPQEVKKVDRARWPYATVGDVMLPIERLHAVAPETPVTEALEEMGRDDVPQLPVVAGSRLQGVISRRHVLRFLEGRAELNM